MIAVIVELGIVIVLSCVGSCATKVVSCASAVAPSNTILESVKLNAVAVKLVIVGELIVGLSKFYLSKSVILLMSQLYYLLPL